MKAEVAIYLQKLQNYFKKNYESSSYFYDYPNSPVNSPENDFFYDAVIRYCDNNLKKNKPIELTKEQFDEIKIMIRRNLLEKKEFYQSIRKIDKLSIEKYFFIN